MTVSWWVDATTQPSPGPSGGATQGTLGHGSAYHETAQQLVLFGGTSQPSSAGEYLDQTWTWNGLWTLQSPGTVPATRAYQAMAWDGNNVVMFGGFLAASTYYTDMWSWDATDWTQLFPATTPDMSRSDYRPGPMCYDGNIGGCTMFGGSYSGGALAETWTWDGSDWTLQSPGSSPPSGACCIAWDEVNLNVVLLTYQGGVPQTWIWDGTNWTEQSPAASPPDRQLGSGSNNMAFAPSVTNVVMYGGIAPGGLTCLNDTWAWDGTNWTELSTGPNSPIPVLTTLVVESQDGTCIFYGGYTAETFPVASNETWVLGSPIPPEGGTVPFLHAHFSTNE